MNAVDIRHISKPTTMNFLAHTALANTSDELLLGGLLGDFVKATLQPPPAGLTPELVRGIRLHRYIDSYLDNYPVFLRSRQRVDPRYRRCAGIMVDVFYDHFLARHWAQFYREPLPVFSARVYDLLDANTAILPPALAHIRQPMRAHDWLTSYQQLPVIHTALNRMSSRLSRPALLHGGAVELEQHYAEFEQDFFLIYAELQHRVAKWLAATPAHR